VDLGDVLPEAFNMDKKEIRTLDIAVSSFRELAAEALGALLETCGLYGDAMFSERAGIAAAWGQSAAARFLASDLSAVHDLAARTLSGEGLSTSELSVLVEERLREIADPWREIASCEGLVKSVAERMEELPLDMQTGKDGRAAETAQLFSNAGEKLFRIFSILGQEGLVLDSFIIDGIPAGEFIRDFNAVLQELSAAYENRDTVLVGDLAEYELAPRLLKFFSALKNFSELPRHTRSGEASVPAI
jgi:hypothetical protein